MGPKSELISWAERNKSLALVETTSIDDDLLTCINNINSYQLCDKFLNIVIFSNPNNIFVS